MLLGYALQEVQTMAEKAMLGSSIYIPGVLLGALETELGNEAAFAKLGCKAKNELFKDQLRLIRLDARKHTHLLATAYKAMTGNDAHPTQGPAPELPESLAEGCESMLFTILDDADIYLRLYSGAPIEIKDICLELLADNQMNAVKLSHISLSEKSC
jgi:hypothetical protein